MLKSIKLFQNALPDHTKTLSAIIKKVKRVRTYERIIPAVLEGFMEFCLSRKGSLMIPDSDGVLSIRAAANVSSSAWRTIRLHPGDGIAGFALQSSEIIFIKDISKTHRYKNFFSKPLKNESLLVIPLVYHQERLGVVNLHGVKSYNREAVEVLADFMSQSLKSALLEKAVVTEPMTGLYNQNYLKKRLGEELKVAQKYNLDLTFMLFDIDFFKKFNDTYGHLAGDFVIKEIANLLKKTLRFSDIKSRYGGEEFAVIMTGTSLSDAYEVAERLRKKIETTTFKYQETQLKVTISVGLASAQKGLDAFSLIRNADEALYKSKQLGRNQVSVFGKI